MRNTSTDLVPKAGLGDWYDYGHGKPVGPSRFTPVELSAMAVFHECADVVAQAAEVLGRVDDATKYAALAQEIASAFHRRWYVGIGEYKNFGSPQTANSMALVTGIPHQNMVGELVQGLLADLEKRNSMQTAGDVGFHFLVRALADFNDSKMIFRMLDRTEKGSYAFIVNAGWTALPESWDANRSFSMNHCMLGHIQEWFMHDLVGIQPGTKTVAFRGFVIKPAMNGNIDAASGSFDSPYGLIKVAWKRDARDEDRWEIRATVPPNTSAQIHLPTAEAKEVLENGKVLEADAMMQVVGTESDRLVIQLPSGEFLFHSPSK